jgi:thiamine biosynthesis lipoprotein
MGTSWRLLLEDRPADAAALRAAIQTRLDQIEHIFSNWKPDSEVSRFNAANTTDPVSCSADLAAVVSVALDIARETDGALDPTLNPLVDLWGFGPVRHHGDLPGEDEIQCARSRCGWQHLVVTLNPPALKKKVPGLGINLSAVVEGFALREIGHLLDTHGIENWLLEIGGELLAGGAPRPGKAWSAGVQAPGAGQGEVFETLTLRDECLSTSGNYRHLFEKDGVRYSHLIDPRTGKPVVHKLASVSVIHRDPVFADGYATAFMILGREKGGPVAQQLGLRVIWIEERP